MRRALTAVLIGGFLFACSSSTPPEDQTPEGPDVPGGVDPSDPLEQNAEGAALYAEMCESCHGEVGEGGIGPVLSGSALGLDGLRSAIDTRMPESDPGRCTGECADKIARFVREALDPAALSCDSVGASPRRLRLLTRREYRNTVRDLFAALGETGSTCQRATDCEFRESCDGGVCLATPCNRHVFVYDPQGQNLGSVHVAGSFNDWPGSRTEGGLPLTFDSASGLWIGDFPLPQGTHQYKLVIDDGGRWIVDPRSPTTVPDGFGGSNSVVELSCANGGDSGFDPAADLPVETRPEGYAFDNNADAALVTAGHVDAYLEAASAIAERAAARADEVVGCDFRGDPNGCADQVIGELGTRAFRRPLLDDERGRYRMLFDQGNAGGGFSAGLDAVVHALLSSPNFLYRSEIGESVGNGLYQLTAYEMATALSYTFWATAPDRELLEAAASGELDDNVGVERHARRLLADPRSREVVGVFAKQWLSADKISTIDKNSALFPEFADLREDLERETEEFVSYVVFESSGTLQELLTADYTFANDRLAALYGLAAPGGDTLRKVNYQGQRLGILGHGSVLGATSHSDQTSPIRRGLFVRGRLLCQDLPPPPPDAGAVPSVDPTATTRERFRQHTDDPVCASCHQYIDDVGFGLESFDPIGRFRTSENGQTIDSSGNLNDVDRLGSGSDAPFSTLPQLANILAESSAPRSCFVRQYYRFARGFEETLFNRCARLWLEQRFADANSDVRELMIATVLAPDFRYRR